MRFAGWLIFVAVLMAASASDAQSKVSLVDATVSTVERVSIGGELVSERVTGEGEKQIVSVETETPNPLVEAYPKANPFPPLAINGSDGWFYADLPAGDYIIRIFDKLESGRWVSEYVPVTVPAEGEPPADDDEPIPPAPPADWQELTELVATFEADGGHTITRDKTTATAWQQALREIVSEIATQATLADARKLVGETNNRVFENRTSFAVSWNPMLQAISNHLQEAEPANVEQYSKAIEAIADGLGEGLER